MEIIETAPAKINLGLDILGKRPDGYHELEMVMTSIDLADRLYFSPLAADQIIVETDNHFLPVDSRNHVYQTIMLLKNRFAITSGIKCFIQKRIPIAAGLGGGSTDAAATLRALNRLWSLELTLPELAQIGLKMGTDVPYCVYGQTAFVSGIGDKVETLPPCPAAWVVVVKPPLSVSTRKIFSQVDMKELIHPPITALKEAIDRDDYPQMIRAVGNSLEAVTMKKYPIVRQIKQQMLNFGADAAVMTGSGPTIIGLCKNHSRAQRAYNSLRGFCQEVYLVHTVNTYEARKI